MQSAVFSVHGGQGCEESFRRRLYPVTVGKLMTAEQSERVNGAANASSEGEQMLIIKGPRCTITVDLLAESGERSSFDLAA